ncbi:c-type cytochrome [Altererythrobacter aquaemixtae]|uniref:C-type cytochrome n=2 Tax=Pontixanthobacter aquaemixtae TaxID=1958940 RepID=A0A844ZV33_9SPHN|nr:c-type cytochrome [Pontixanthobacter aquaemixtae]
MANGGPPASFAQCSACHSPQPGKSIIGPTLAGVYGANAGHIDDFAYSTAMRESGLTWDDETLSRYLENPAATVPGTKMSYSGMRDAAKRAELIEYLKTL